MARQQYEFERSRYEQQLADAKQAQERAEREEADRERRAAAERLRQLSEDMLSPNEGPGIFAEPVAGCGRNKNKPQAPTVNVIVQPWAQEPGAWRALNRAAQLGSVASRQNTGDCFGSSLARSPRTADSHCQIAAYGIPRKEKALGNGKREISARVAAAGREVGVAAAC